VVWAEAILAMAEVEGVAVEAKTTVTTMVVNTVIRIP
jgi:hypothetical protein